MTQVKTNDLQAELDNFFQYHAPVNDQADRYAEIRSAGKAFAETIAKHCPPSADRTHAIRVIRDAVFWANASIACSGEQPKGWALPEGETL